MLSLDLLVERFCFEIGDVPDGGEIYGEKRSPVLDHQLDIAWLNLKVQGTGFVPARTINSRITDLHTRSKEAKFAGLQMADLVVSPVGRFVLGKPMKEDWTVIESKFRRRRGSNLGEGLVVLPR